MADIQIRAGGLKFSGYDFLPERIETVKGLSLTICNSASDPETETLNFEKEVIKQSKGLLSEAIEWKLCSEVKK